MEDVNRFSIVGSVEPTHEGWGGCEFRSIDRGWDLRGWCDPYRDKGDWCIIILTIKWHYNDCRTYNLSFKELLFSIL